MVKLNLVKSSNDELVSKPLVAVFVGATSGIGAYTVRCLAKTHGKTGKGLRVYIVGRNAKAAESIIAECQKSCPAGQFLFQSANDLALMKEVDITCKQLIKTEEKEASAKGETPRIDILVMSHANFKPWDPRNETSEGLDTFMSLLFYSRARFTTNLLPLLLSSSLPAHVVSVFGPGRDASFFPDDLSLRDPKNYGFMSSGSHAAYLKTFFFEYLAAKYPGKLSLCHYFPGLVLHEGFDSGLNDPSFPWWFKASIKYLKPIMKLAPSTVPCEESGERTLFNASKRFPPKSVDGKANIAAAGAIGVAESSDGVLGGGSYRVNYNGEQVAIGKQYKKMREDGWAEKSVQHTLKCFEDIEATGHFSG
ncbi:uncharacterized protein LY89DRAFT_633581 [Mollisia scopiformis]|uniref:Uncharacterized protein n=1 Tax=Mollisia scopiformis TaxID=149040 RepID=A0A194XUR1_MOLSC|nr:uncharacterized protein LY89DRAFT_633581 [Mollisia scopiformis]KUJ23876.1 hypothetical protein LY89DRAFT_633581 [Mollisia scopiformis]